MSDSYRRAMQLLGSLSRSLGQSNPLASAAMSLGKNSMGRSPAGWTKDNFLEDLAQFAVLEDQFCKDFKCCGATLENLHDLLQHFEECHVRVESDFGDDDDDLPFDFMDEEIEDDHEEEESASSAGGASGKTPAVFPSNTNPSATAAPAPTQPNVSQITFADFASLKAHLVSSLRAAAATSRNGSARPSLSNMPNVKLPTAVSPPSAMISRPGSKSKASNANSSIDGKRVVTSPIATSSLTTGLITSNPVTPSALLNASSNPATPVGTVSGRSLQLPSATKAGAAAEAAPAGAINIADVYSDPYRMTNPAAFDTTTLRKKKRTHEGTPSSFSIFSAGTGLQHMSAMASSLPGVASRRRRRKVTGENDEDRLDKDLPAPTLPFAIDGPDPEVVSDLDMDDLSFGRRVAVGEVDDDDGSAQQHRGADARMGGRYFKGPRRRKSGAGAGGQHEDDDDDEMDDDEDDDDDAAQAFARAPQLASGPPKAPTVRRGSTKHSRSESANFVLNRRAVGNAATSDLDFGKTFGGAARVASAASSKLTNHLSLSHVAPRGSDGARKRSTSTPTFSITSPSGATSLSVIDTHPNAASAFPNASDIAALLPQAEPLPAKDERRYKCKMEGCQKAYKNPNGLKYHLLHGHTEDTGDPEIDHLIQRPYQCTAPRCDKRYKNLNGLK
ncbi:Transcriptional regulator of ribosomal biogenesis proteins, partial [Irineochytrium annulatum]